MLLSKEIWKSAFTQKQRGMSYDIRWFLFVFLNLEYLNYKLNVRLTKSYFTLFHMQSSSSSFAQVDCCLLIPEKWRVKPRWEWTEDMRDVKDVTSDRILTLTCGSLTRRRSCQCSEHHSERYCCCSRILGPGSKGLHWSVESKDGGV